MFVRLPLAVLVAAAPFIFAGCTGEPSDCEDCNSGEDLDNQACTDCPDDTGTPSTGASFIGPPVSFTDATGAVFDESCQSNLVAKESGPSYTAMTDEEITVEPLTYTVAFGDPTLASEASDGLPLHTLANGWLAISPPIDLTVETGDGPTEPTPPAMNLFIQGTWTCEQDDGWSDTQTAVYTDGYLLTLPARFRGEMSGMNISYEADGDSITGIFESDAFVHIEAHFTFGGDHLIDCWAGRPDDDPR